MPFRSIMPLEPLPAVQPQLIAELLVQALENERALDVAYRMDMPPEAAPSGWIPNYKPMAQLSLRRRFGVLYRPFIAAAIVGIALGQAACLALAFVRSLGRGERADDVVCLLPTIPSNRALILEAMAQAPDVSAGPAVRMIDLDPPMLARLIGRGGVLRAGAAVLRVYADILTGATGRRLDLLLHMRDAFALALLTAFTLQRPTCPVWTDDHYQRWAFLLSHASRRLHIVQHGFLSDTIPFAHPFGTVALLAVRAERFVALFAAHFRIGRWYIFRRTHPEASGPREAMLLLASSAPHVAEEIEFLQRFRAGSALPVAVKLHPAHTYDERKERLLALADRVCAKDERPVVTVFVSHSSFMELDYAENGALTCSIARSGGGAAAADRLLEILQPQPR